LSNTQQHIIQIANQIQALEQLLKKKDQQLNALKKDNEKLQIQLQAIEQEKIKLSQQKMANQILQANLPDEEKRKVLQQIEKYLKTIELTIEQFVIKK
jgi:seryl-tRNA synthetase